MHSIGSGTAEYATMQCPLGMQYVGWQAFSPPILLLRGLSCFWEGAKLKGPAAHALDI